MKIGFKSQLFLKGNKTGIAWYAENIIKELLKDSKNEYQCDYFSLHYDKDKIEEVEKFKEQGAAMNPCIWFHDVLYKLIWPFISIPYRWFFGKKTDITQFFNYVVPPGVKGKKVTCVYDMAYRVYPETVRTKTRKWLQLTLEQSCERADAIVTISEFSKSQIMKYLHIDADKIWVAPCGVDREIYNLHGTLEQKEAIKAKYSIEGEYFLYLGTLEPRKNVERLIEAYSLLVHDPSIKENIAKLVLAGGKGWLYETIFQKVHELKLEDKVIFTGYIAETDKPILMQGAKAFLFLSLYEGFGMPPLEAMACGTPVMVSNVSSLPEVVGDAALLANPYSPESIAEGLRRLIQDDKLRTELSRKGSIRADEFNWVNSARVFKKIYQTLEIKSDSK